MLTIGCCWIFAITKYGYPPSIENTMKVMGEIANLGFRYTELEGVGEENLRAVYAARKEIKAYADGRGVHIFNFCPVLADLVSVDDARRARALDAYKVGVEVANYFGCSLVHTCSFTPPVEFIGEAPYKAAISFNKQFRVRIGAGFNWDRQWEVLVETFRTCARLAGDAGLKLCIEPRVGEMVSNTDAALRLIEHVGEDSLGIVLDTAHQHAQKEILALSVEKLRDRIFYLHLSDNDSSANEHLALGEGTVDWESIFIGLKRHGFNGFAALDLGMIPNLEAELQASRGFLQDLLKRLDIPFRE